MRLLHVYSGNLFGGVERMLVTLAATAPPELTHEFALTSEGQLRDELEREGAAVTLLGEARASRPDLTWRARTRLRTALARGFDAVVCHSAWAQALFSGEARRAGVRQIFWLHDAASGSHWLDRLAARQRPSLVIANSEYTRSTLDRMYPGCPSTVIYCPVPRPVVAEGERDRVRAELGASADVAVILLASRLQPWKGHRVLLDALSTMSRTRWTCWIAGAAAPEDESYAHDLLRHGLGPGVRFLGHRTDVAALMAAADIFCQPSLLPEPFGMATVEAMWMGLPVVASAAGGALETVTAANGRLVKQGCPADLARALDELAGDPELRHRLGKHGPERARRLSDPAARQQELLDAASSRERRAA